MARSNSFGLCANSTVVPDSQANSGFVPDSQAEAPIQAETPLQAVPLQAEAMVVSSSRARGQVADTRKLTDEHYRLIVEWLEIPPNFQKLTGAGTRTEVAAKHPSKKSVYTVMLAELTAKGFPPVGLSLETAWANVLTVTMPNTSRLYNSRMAQEMVFTERELRVGMTIEQKLHKMCPFFNRLHTLYGARHNVNPPSEAFFGIPGGGPDVVTGSGSDDEGLDSMLERLQPTLDTGQGYPFCQTL